MGNRATVSTMACDCFANSIRSRRTHLRTLGIIGVLGFTSSSCMLPDWGPPESPVRIINETEVVAWVELTSFWMGASDEGQFERKDFNVAPNTAMRASIRCGELIAVQAAAPFEATARGFIWDWNGVVTVGFVMGGNVEFSGIGDGMSLSRVIVFVEPTKHGLDCHSDTLVIRIQSARRSDSSELGTGLVSVE